MAGGQAVPAVPSSKPRVAILDDYQNVALSFADWSLGDRVEITVFNDHVRDENALVERLAPFAVVVAFRDLWKRPPLALAFLAVACPLALAYAWRSMPNNLCHPEAYAALLHFLKS